MDLTGFGSIADLATHILDRFVPDPAQKAAAALEMMKAQQAGEFKEMDAQLQMAQMQSDVNKTEAASGSMFVAGARPFIMWICGFAFLYVTIIEPIARFVAQVMYQYTGAFPAIDTSITMQALFGMLGLGAMRSFEKTQGVATTAIKSK